MVTDPTPAWKPITLDEQIAVVHNLALALRVPHSPAEMRAVLSTLQQHKLALAVIEAARPTASPSRVYLDKPGSMAKLRAALAAFDAARAENRDDPGER